MNYWKFPFKVYKSQNPPEVPKIMNQIAGWFRQTDGTNNGKELDEEIALKDLHAKTKRFMESNDLSINEINKLYYSIRDGKILPLYDSLGSNKLAESQVRLGLLTAFENSMDIGEFEFNGEVVRIDVSMKSYDKVNFATNFKNNKYYLMDLKQYEKDIKIKLSSTGKDWVTKLLKELANRYSWIRYWRNS